MITYSAQEAETKFGEVINAALERPVSITKHNQPSVVVMSDAQFRHLTGSQYEHLQSEVQAGFAQLDRGETSPYSVDEIFEQVLARKSNEA